MTLGRMPGDVPAPEADELDDLGMVEVELRFREAGLPSPPVPVALRGRIRARNEWIFSTRTGVPDPYALDWYLDEAAAGWPADYAVVGHDGHGMASWAIHLYVVSGPVGVFIQVPFGGAYTDDTAAAREIGSAFRAAERLLDAGGSAPAGAGPVVVVWGVWAGHLWGSPGALAASSDPWRDAEAALAGGPGCFT